MAKKQESDPLTFMVQTAEAAGRFFGVGAPTIRAWISRGAPGRRGRYPLDELARWRLGRGADDEALRVAKLRRETALAKRAELEADRLAAEVIPITKHQEIVNDRMRCFVSVLNRLPAELFPRCFGRPLDEAQMIAREWLHAMRKWMCKEGEHPEDILRQ